jgi:hypothetical protein
MTFNPFFLISQSTVLSGVESQLLVFFKTSPDFTQHPGRLSLQCLLILTYISLIFSVSATISSFVLTRSSGTNPMPVGSFRNKATDTGTCGFDTPHLQTRSNVGIDPQRWGWIESHCAYDHVLGVQSTNRSYCQGCSCLLCLCSLSLPRSF